MERRSNNYWQTSYVLIGHKVHFDQKKISHGTHSALAIAHYDTFLKGESLKEIIEYKKLRSLQIYVWYRGLNVCVCVQVWIGITVPMRNGGEGEAFFLMHPLEPPSPDAPTLHAEATLHHRNTQTKSNVYHRFEVHNRFFPFFLSNRFLCVLRIIPTPPLDGSCFCCPSVLC